MDIVYDQGEERSNSNNLKHGSQSKISCWLCA
jgi:hypothetical protein